MTSNSTSDNWKCQRPTLPPDSSKLRVRFTAWWRAWMVNCHPLSRAPPSALPKAQKRVGSVWRHRRAQSCLVNDTNPWLANKYHRVIVAVGNISTAFGEVGVHSIEALWTGTRQDKGLLALGCSIFSLIISLIAGVSKSLIDLYTAPYSRQQLCSQSPAWKIKICCTKQRKTRVRLWLFGTEVYVCRQSIMCSCKASQMDDRVRVNPCS